MREVGGGRGGIRVVQDKCSLGRLPPTFAMSTAQTVSAKDFWTTARSGNLTPWSLAKVYAFHKVSALKNLDLEHTEIAKMVTKVGGGHPCPKAIQKLRKQFDEDPEWYPGKGMETRKRPGPKPLFSAQKKRNVAECAMAMARRGEDVTVQAVQARAPRASCNPSTGEPFDKKLVLQVFRTLCHDGDPEDTWDLYTAYHKTALLPALLPLRLKWAKKVLALHDDPGWFYRHVVWFDPCNTVVPKGPRACFNQKQAGRGRGQHWSSKATRHDNAKLSGSKHGAKQAAANDKRVWWFVVLARGVVRLKVMPADWEQSGAGMARFVDGLNDLLEDMLGADVAKPRVCFTDRGPGLYNSLNGEIVQAYYNALTANNFRPFAGVGGTWQPADLADFFLHETVVAWVRKLFRKHPFKAVENVEANCQAFHARLQECEDHINANYKVDALCRDAVKRLRDLQAKRGARLKH